MAEHISGATFWEEEFAHPEEVEVVAWVIGERCGSTSGCSCGGARTGDLILIPLLFAVIERGLVVLV